MHIRLQVTPELSLTELLPSDMEAVIQHLADREISDRTTGIAFPYGPEEFDVTMKTVAERAWENGHPVHFAVRNSDDFFIGCVVFSDLVEGHSAEVGYWPGKPFWGRGVMTAAVGVACKYAIKKWGLVRISAPVFEGNLASSRVLEKTGFVCEGFLRRYYFTNGRYIDSQLFALLPEFPPPPF